MKSLLRELFFNRETKEFPGGWELAEKILQMLYLGMLLLVLPLFLPRGYEFASTDKIALFVRGSFLFWGLEGLCLLGKILGNGPKKSVKRALSLSTVFALVFLGSCLLSFALSSYKETALFGEGGWSMGLVTLLLCLSLYFFSGKLLRNAVWIPIFGSAGLFLVSLITLIHRAGIPVFGLVPEIGQNLSTIGNINWLCGYLVITAIPLLIFQMENVRRKRRLPILCNIFLWLAAITGLLALLFQGSASGLVALGGVTLLYAVYRLRKSSRKGIRMLGGILLGASVVAAGGFVLLLAVNTKCGGTISTSPALIFDKNWGSLRGATWTVGFDLWLSLPIFQKLTGVGPDCFGQYLYGDAPMAILVYAKSCFGGRLLNAHNEGLTLLVNGGILGFAGYYGLLTTAAVHSFRKAEGTFCCLGFAFFGILINNIFSFWQILTLPVLFLLMGLLSRKTEENALFSVSEE